MQTTKDCIPCTISSLIRLANSSGLKEKDSEELMRRLLSFLAEADYKKSPPVIGKEMHRMIREYLNDPDPYYDIKIKYNKMMLQMYSDFQEIVEAAEDPFNIAMRLAVAGNVIDFGSKLQLDIIKTINKIVKAHFAIDDSQLLKNEIKKANSVLYIGDNCGEIVLDKLFLESLDVPKKYFAVRGGPVLNDITTEDAELVNFSDDIKIITTGDDAPGAVWSTSSEKFKKIFNEVDVIISKGQGNLEGLLGMPNNIFFLLVIKCELIGKLIGADKGDFVVKKNWNNNILDKLTTD